MAAMAVTVASPASLAVPASPPSGPPSSDGPPPSSFPDVGPMKGVSPPWAPPSGALLLQRKRHPQRHPKIHPERALASNASFALRRLSDHMSRLGLPTRYRPPPIMGARCSNRASEAAFFLAFRSYDIYRATPLRCHGDVGRRAA